MFERIIPYIADPENPVPGVLQEQWAKRDTRLIPYTNLRETAEAGVCLLFAPYRSHERYLAVEAIWKKYFSKHAPEVLLVVIGTLPGQDQNYFDILFLPDDPADLFQGALPAKSGWALPAPDGVDVQEKLKRFVDGHSAAYDPDQSVREAFGRVRKGLQLYFEELPLGMSAEEILRKIFNGGISKHFNAFMARWERYQPYFEALPFSHIFVEMGNLASEMDVQFKQPPPNDALAAWIAHTLALANDLYAKIVTVENYVRAK